MVRILLHTLNPTKLHLYLIVLKPFIYAPNIEIVLKNWYFSYEVKVLDELETKVEPAVHELRLGWSTDDTDMQLGKDSNKRVKVSSRKV